MKKNSNAELYQLFVDHEDVMHAFQSNVYKTGIAMGTFLGLSIAQIIMCTVEVNEKRKREKELEKQEKEILNKMRKES